MDDQTLYKMVEVTKGDEPAEGEDRQTFHAIVSTGTVDRDGDVVVPSGWDLKDFRQNPVVLFGHNPFHPAVGSFSKIGVTEEPGHEGKVLAGDFSFNPDTQLGKELQALYAAKDMRALSVGFLPKPDGRKEILDEQERLTGFRFTRQRLLEVSAVPIPANTEALTRMAKAAAPHLQILLKSAGLDPAEIRRVESLERRLEAIAICMGIEIDDEGVGKVADQHPDVVQKAQEAADEEVAFALIAAAEAGPSRPADSPSGD